MECAASSVQVWLFIPDNENVEQRVLRQEVDQEAKSRDWTLVVRTARQCKVTGGPEQGRPYLLVEPRDAGDVYAAMHRHRTLVLATAACSVRRDPSARPVPYRHMVNISSFVLYKSSFGVVRGPNDARRFMERFEDWPAADSCDGPRDPRVLPLHIFDDTAEWLRLDEPSQVDDFAREFGPANSRRDAKGRSWDQASVLHGSDSLRVAECLLAQGFHWDVIRRFGAEHVFTTHEIWRLYNKNSYCNIYPDGYVRAGSKSSGGISRRIWPTSLYMPMPRHQAGHCSRLESSSYTNMGSRATVWADREPKKYFGARLHMRRLGRR